MNELIFPLMMAACVIVTTIVLVLSPRLSPPTVPLGVNVPASKADHPVVHQTIRGYKVIVIVAGIATAVLCLILRDMPILSALSTIVLVIVSLVAYTTQRKKIIAAKEQERWFHTENGGGFAADDPADYEWAFNEIEPPHFPWICFILSGFSIVFAVLMVASVWDTLPEMIPTHWGPNMEADAWSEKSFWSVFAISLINTGIVAFMVLITAMVCKSGQTIAPNQSVAAQLRNRATIAGATKGMGMLTLILAVALSFDQIISVQPRYEHLIGLGFGLIIGGTLVGVIAVIAPILSAQNQANELIRINNIPQQATTTATTSADHGDNDDEDKHYLWGMFYNNPDDPAVMVQKRFGTGMDFNYAHWQGKAFLGVITLAALGGLALALFAVFSG